jgi:hypothetical protein
VSITIYLAGLFAGLKAYVKGLNFQASEGNALLDSPIIRQLCSEIRILAINFAWMTDPEHT